jgi:hypothetical protein
MVALGEVLLGVFFALAGGLAAVDHPVVDWFNRSVKAAGTTRRASEVEMSTVAVAVGRIIGLAMMVFGMALVVNGL